MVSTGGHEQKKGEKKKKKAAANGASEAKHRKEGVQTVAKVIVR